ncbi:hypothetical protein [uncultured Methylobacterium sp.]|uniref:hypothetical protein n=1 Tax=uncultured Methylobacterium sp. TaxID=157278 RepID=UPI0035C9573E
MRTFALAALGAIAIGVGVASTAHAADYGYVDDAPAAVVTRRTVVERPVFVEPRPVVREVVVERPVIYRPPPVVREVVVERPVVYRPRREVVVEREGFHRHRHPAFADPDGYHGPRRFGPRPVRFGRGPGFDPYD